MTFDIHAIQRPRLSLIQRGLAQDREEPVIPLGQIESEAIASASRQICRVNIATVTKIFDGALDAQDRLFGHPPRSFSTRSAVE